MPQGARKLTSLMDAQSLHRGPSRMGGIVNPQCLPVLRKLAREFEVSEAAEVTVSNAETIQIGPSTKMAIAP